MIFALLSRRVRGWIAFSLLLPLVGRLMQALGLRVTERNPNVGKALTTAGDLARSPRTARRARRTRLAS